MIKKLINTSLLFILSLFICNAHAFSQSQFVKTIYFKSNSFSIDKKYENSLDLIARKLSSDTFSYLKIFAYADISGSTSHNDILSEKRATAVYDYLASRTKFDTTRVYVTWLGESEDAYDLHFPMAHIQQRCADIWIQYNKKKKLDKPKQDNR